MKKITVLILFLLIGSAVFGLDMAVGAGGLWGMSFQSAAQSSYYEANIDRMALGGFIFFDLGYVEFSAAFGYRSGTFNERILQDNGGWEVDNTDYAAPSLSFGLYVKNPFSVTDRLFLAPMAGVDFEFYMDEGLIKKGINIGWWNDLWLRFGLELDFFFNDNFFLRGEALYGMVILFNRDEEYFFDMRPGHGPLIRLGVGYLF